MSRFAGDDYDPNFNNESFFWEQALERHMSGPKGQAVLRELREALLAMPDKRLISGRLADESGCVCTVGALAAYRDPGSVKRMAALVREEDDGYIDSWESEEATMSEGQRLGLKRSMACELAHVNDDTWKVRNETPEQRYERVLAWVEKRILSVEVA